MRTALRFWLLPVISLLLGSVSFAQMRPSTIQSVPASVRGQGGETSSQPEVSSQPAAVQPAIVGLPTEPPPVATGKAPDAAGLSQPAAVQEPPEAEDRGSLGAIARKMRAQKQGAKAADAKTVAAPATAPVMPADAPKNASAAEQSKPPVTKNDQKPAESKPNPR